MVRAALLFTALPFALAACAGEAELAGAPSPPSAAAGYVDKDDGPVGPVVTLSCDVQDTWVAAGGYTAVDVQAKDRAGQASRNWTVEVRPLAGARVAQRDKLIFDLPGTYTVRCCARDADLCDVAAVQVGAKDPALALSLPPFTRGRQALLAGQVVGEAPFEVTVQGQAVPVDGDGRFATTLPVGPGLATVAVQALDARGQTTRHAWTLAGDFRAPGDAVPGAVAVAIGPQAYPTLSDLAARAVQGFLNDPAQHAALMQPLAGTALTHAWAFTPQRLSARDTAVSLSPARDGVAVMARVQGLRLAGTGRTRFRVLGRWKTRSVQATVGTLTVRGRLVLGARPRLADVRVDLADLDLAVSDLGGLFEDALAGILDGTIADGLRDSLTGSAGGAVQGVLDGFARTIPVELPPPLHGTLALTLGLQGARAGADGLTARLSLAAQGPPDPLRAELPGPWKTGASPAAPQPTGGYGAALAVDALNAVAHAAWQGAALDASQVIGAEALPQAPALPALHGVDLFVDPRLPPLVRATGAPGAVLLEVGGLRVDAVLETELGFLNAGVEVGARVAVQLSTHDATLTAKAEVQALTVDVLAAPATLQVEPLRRFLAQVIEAQVLPRLADLTASAPLPSADLSALGLPALSRVRPQAVRWQAAPGGVAVTGALAFE